MNCFFLVIAMILTLKPVAIVLAAGKTAGNVPNDSARIYHDLGVENFLHGDYENASKFFLRNLNITKQSLGPLASDMASTYNNLGLVSRRLFNIEDAMEYYDTAQFIYIKHYGPDYSRLGAVYQNQGNILREKRDLGSALAYYNNALRIFLNNREDVWVARVYNNIGLAYEMAGDPIQAIDYYLRSIDIRKGIDPTGIALPAGNLANCYRSTGDYIRADQYFRMALGAISETWGADHPYLAINFMNYGLFLISDANEYEKGYEFLLRALETHLSAFGEKGQHTARTYMNIGYYHQITGEFDSALEYFQRSLIANSESFDPADLTENPDVDEIVFSLDYMLASLKHKASVFMILADIENEQGNLKNSLSTYRAALSFIERIRMGHYMEDSRLLLSENEHETFMQAFNTAWRLYKLTYDKRYLEEAFEFSEKSKAASLLESLRDVEARSFGGVPEELLEREQELRRRIAAYRELIYDEHRNPDPDPRRITLWEGRVFSLELELRQLIGRLEEDYPDYYSLKYDRNIFGVNMIMQAIDPRDALVSYVYNDSLLYIFTITSNKANLYRVEPLLSLEDEIVTLMDIITSGNIDRGVRNDFLSFTTSSHNLYRILIEPVIKDIKGKRLIIVPDGLLAYIPFELLLSSENRSGYTNYRSLPYLLRDFTVSYNYSATLWRQNLHKTPKFRGNILAVAPRYEYSELNAFEGIANRRDNRERLTPLPGAREEAIRIAELIGGDVLLDDMATESLFKQQAGNYQLLHLAMHTLIDDDNPMYSKLVFTDQKSGDDDGFLNTFEIYNLSLNAALAVLSSCRSGYGILRYGEGIMSLARGFFYAGVPSIVMTNWEIEDRSGAEIMINFYKYLLKGYRKDEALRLARLDFLNNTDMLRAHPYFWGAFVSIGNPGEIFSTYRQYYPVIAIFLVVIILLIILWRGHFWRS